MPSTLDSFPRLEHLAAGVSGIVCAIGNQRVVKEYLPDEDEGVECRAYELLGPHPNIARFLLAMEKGFIILKRGEVLRKIFQRVEQIPLQTKLSWLQDAATGLIHIHEQKIVHADVGCHNTILTGGIPGFLKTIDFADCSIDGEVEGFCYEWCAYGRSVPTVSVMIDIFAFGCMIYEIITHQQPWPDLEQEKNRGHLPMERYARNENPDVGNLPLADMMKNCWVGTYVSKNELVLALEVASSVRQSWDSTPSLVVVTVAI